MRRRCSFALAALALGCSGDPPAASDEADDDRRDGGGRDAAPADGGPVGTPFAYVASPPDDRIYVYALDPATGALDPRSSVEVEGPSFLAFDPRRGALYSTVASGDVAAFAVDRATGALTPLGQVSAEGAGPVHVQVTPGGDHLLVASYTAGSVAVLPIQTDGGLGDAVDRETPGEKAHLITTDPDGAFAFVPTLGLDAVAQYRFDDASGQLTPNRDFQVATAAGAGPRHLAFAPDGEHAYLINELDSTLTALALDAEGRLRPLATVATLPDGFDGENTTAEVEVHPGGRFVYGSNRGHDSIAGFAIAADGTLDPIGHTPTGGATPRHFSIAPGGELLFVGNLASDHVTAFRVDRDGGALAPLGVVAEVAGPEFVGVFSL